MPHGVVQWVRVFGTGGCPWVHHGAHHGSHGAHHGSHGTGPGTESGHQATLVKCGKWANLASGQINKFTDFPTFRDPPVIWRRAKELVENVRKWSIF